MTIHEAVEKLSAFLDMVNGWGCLTDQELEDIQAVEEMIIDFVEVHT